MLNHQYQNHSLPIVPPQPLMQQTPVHQPIPDTQRSDNIHGFGRLTWLSAKAGLITCKDNMVISFQLKDFCDQMLNDLTSVCCSCRLDIGLSTHVCASYDYGSIT